MIAQNPKTVLKLENSRINKCLYFEKNQEVLNLQGKTIKLWLYKAMAVCLYIYIYIYKNYKYSIYTAVYSFSNFSQKLNYKAMAV
jgi:hypothetical protein